MFNKKQAIYIANKLGITFDKFSVDDFLTGINIELEHGLIDLNTNVTDDDLEKTAKIALAHLNEYYSYYNQEYGLPALERFLAKKENKKDKS